MQKRLDVLLVEDNESDANLIIRCLEKAGYTISSERVETIEDLKAALKSKKWTIVFSDYQLPGLDGMSALEIFKTYNLDIPFIIISGTIGEEAAVNIIKSGAQNYVMKGNLQKLPSVVANELAEAADRLEQKDIEERAGLEHGGNKISALGELSSNFFKMNLHYLLEKNSIKQSQLSREINISKQTISDWLKKDSLINVQQALKLTKYFKITVEELLTCNLKNLVDSAGKDDLNFLKKIQTPLFVMNADCASAQSNQAFCDLLGFNEYDLNSRPLTELIHPEDLAHLLIQFKRAMSEKVLFSQIDMRYITSKGAFRWLNSVCVYGVPENKMFIFSVAENPHGLEGFSAETFLMEKSLSKELDRIQLSSLVEKKLQFLNEVDRKVSISIDRDVFKCLIRSLCSQFQCMEFESKENFEVHLKSRIENEKIFLCATINCAINPERLDLSRLQKIAGLVGTEVFENYAGNIYSLYLVFPK